MALTVSKKQPNKKKQDKGRIDDIRVKFDYRLFLEKSPIEMSELHEQAQFVAHDIYKKLDWNFHLENLMVGLSYGRAKKSKTGKQTVWFSIDWATSGISDNVLRRTCLRSEQQVGTHSYHSWDKMWSRFKNDTLDDIIVSKKSNPLFTE